MHTLIIGHRGVGKSRLLERLKNYFPESVCLCLDSEIEKAHGSIKDIFAKQGEAQFRIYEADTLKALIARFTDKVRPIFIALGGGYKGPYPVGWEVLHLQRDVNVENFLFPDRPNLSADGLRMPVDLFNGREKNYPVLATYELVLREGMYDSLPEEKLFFGEDIENQKTIENLGGILTLSSQQVKTEDFNIWARRRLRWGIAAFELRDDLLSEAEMKLAMAVIPKSHLILSYRQREDVEKTNALAESFSRIDWPLEFGEMPKAIRERAYYSLHSQEGEFEKHLAVISANKEAFKWAPVVKNISQLRKGHEWYKQAPAQRSFLPQSPTGRWVWYRLLTKNQMPIQFIREGKGSSPDQPTLLQWLARGTTKKLAGILGSPVKHSWTPTFHQEFFRTKEVDILPVDMSEGELDKAHFGFLHELGFRAFAVTSPLKKWAGDFVKSPTPLNTLVWNKKKYRWEGFNTDTDGLQVLLQEILPHSAAAMVVWGGGGVLDSIRTLRPHVSFYSARSGQPREGQASIQSPHSLIWAAGATSASMPPATWKPQFVFDLSYTPDSRGIEYAYTVGARYISGQEMFITQALKQQEIWKNYEF